MLTCRISLLRLGQVAMRQFVEAQVRCILLHDVLILRYPRTPDLEIEAWQGIFSWSAVRVATRTAISIIVKRK